MCKISIITPAYNAGKYIERCIKSVIGQTYSDFEHIIVDDGSIDSTPNICDEYAKKDDRIKVIHKANGGVSKARNDAIKIATGNYLLFVDADDWLEKDMCEKMIMKALSEDLDIVVSGYYNYYENENRKESIILREFPERNLLELITDDISLYGGFPWNKLVKREKISFLFNTDIHYYENLLFFVQNLNEKTKYGVVPDPLYNYCINDGSAVHNKKYSIKRFSTLEALKIIIPLVPIVNRDAHKLLFINSYYYNKYYMKKGNIDVSKLDEYQSLKDLYYKDCKKSKTLNFKSKIKLFVLCKLTIAYNLYQTMRNR